MAMLLQRKGSVQFFIKPQYSTAQLRLSQADTPDFRLYCPRRRCAPYPSGCSRCQPGT